MFADVRLNVLRHELAGGVADEPLFGGQVCLQTHVVEHVGSRRAAGKSLLVVLERSENRRRPGQSAACGPVTSRVKFSNSCLASQDAA